ncbi:DNA-binding protein [Streptomyces sp. NPDC006355]|uniref:DNA-binding protein n=1 Tax=Streptomyces sp. NPDC006355 TaxID=3156758 RepID=UPI0033B4A16A
MTQEDSAVKALTVREVLDLPATVDVETAARALGFSRSYGYALARADQFPCRVIRAGRLFRVQTVDLRRVLGVEDRAATTVAA